MKQKQYNKQSNNLNKIEHKQKKTVVYKIGVLIHFVGLFFNSKIFETPTLSQFFIVNFSNEISVS